MSRPRIEPSEFDENDESSSQVKAGIFDIGKNIGLNSEMKRTFSPLSPLAAIGVLGLQAWRNSVNKKPYYAGKLHMFAMVCVSKRFLFKHLAVSYSKVTVGVDLYKGLQNNPEIKANTHTHLA